MRGQFRKSATMATVFAAVALLTGVALPQPAAALDPGHPNFEGVWMAYATVPSGRLGALSAKLSAAGKAAVKAFTDEYGADHPEAGWYCVGTGMPYAMGNLAAYPIEIMQTPSHTVMLLELEQQVRRIFTDGRDFPKDYPRTRMGYSIGHWDGDTLVVETRNFKNWPIGDAPRSEAMEITENFTLTSRDKVKVQPSGFVADVAPLNDKVLIDHMTIKDSRYYAEPLTVDVYFQTVDDKDTLEYDCTVDQWQQALDAHKKDRKKD